MTSPADRPIITLTTDFGLADHYVGAMRGVILTRCPEAQICDISHDVPSFSLLAGAYTLAQAAPYFPAGTVHVAVVDPGVGTERRAVLLAALGHYFVAPDNGLLSLIVALAPDWKVWQITNRTLWLPALSQTFHGRDLFAPVAASLAAGLVEAKDVGPAVHKLELLADLEATQLADGRWQGRILSIDRFGNVITNLPAAHFPVLGTDSFRLECGAATVRRWRETFGRAERGECFVYFGSSGYLEIALNQGSAARELGCQIGDSVRLELEPAGRAIIG